MIQSNFCDHRECTIQGCITVGCLKYKHTIKFVTIVHSSIITKLKELNTRLFTSFYNWHVFGHHVWPYNRVCLIPREMDKSFPRLNHDRMVNKNIGPVQKTMICYKLLIIHSHSIGWPNKQAVFPQDFRIPDLVIIFWVFPFHSRFCASVESRSKWLLYHWHRLIVTVLGGAHLFAVSAHFHWSANPEWYYKNREVNRAI